MEAYQNYRGYGITYIPATGTTIVTSEWKTLWKVVKVEEYYGIEMAKEFIDELIEKGGNNG